VKKDSKLDKGRLPKKKWSVDGEQKYLF
jgi:hypothetical protein